MSQTTLDDFTSHVCPRCGRAFSSEKGLKTHLGWHRREDFMVVIRYFRAIDEDSTRFTPKEFAILLKAIRDGCEDTSRAITILSQIESFKDLVDAIKHEGADIWRRRCIELLSYFIESGCMESVNNVISIYAEEKPIIPQDKPTYVG